jgi:hypothetical protein
MRDKGAVANRIDYNLSPTPFIILTNIIRAIQSSRREINMAIQLLRGHVRDLTIPDKHGGVSCQLGKCTVKVYGDLVSSIGKGDDILLACVQRSDVYHALAVKNIDKGKTAQIDPTNNILILAGSVFVCMLGFVLDLQAESSGIIVQSMDMIVGFIGLIGIGISLRRLFLITRAGTWVRHAEV